jgi:putative drug exporter of the RND superfamily
MAAPGGIFDRIGNIVLRWPLLVIAAWVAFAAVLALTLPPLMVEAGKRPQKPLPDDAPTMVVQQEMDKAFAAPGSGGGSGGGGSGGGGSLLMIVLTDEKGLTAADEDVYRKLVGKLHEDTQDKMSAQDFLGSPEMREVFASKDGKAITLPVSFPDAAVAPTTLAAFHRVSEIAKQVTAGTSVNAYVSGPVATLADATEMAMEDAHFIEIATVISVLVILFVIYRSVVTMLVPLLNIGASVATSQGVLSGLSELGLPVNMQTIVLMSAVMIGAGTDYAVFLISRYHDYVRRGDDSDQAVKKALMSIGKVIAASAATVAVTFLAMVFTKLEVFSDVGPAIAISIVVALASALTLLPAMLVLTGRRGWIKPRRDLTTRFWRRTGTRIVRKPRIHLVGSLIVLIALASCATLVQFNYDDLKTMPDTVDSSKGYEAMNRHFPQNMMTPMVLFIKSPRDLRTASALADLEQMAARVSQLPDITAVRGLTRPKGDPLEQTKVSFQAGEVGNKLDEASDQIQNHGGDLDKLVNGANQLADALAGVRDQVNQAVTSLSGVVTTLTTLEVLIGGDKTIATLEQAAQLAGQMRSLGDSLGSSTSDAQSTAVWAAPMVTALNSSPECNTDPSCQRSRAGLSALVQANNDGTLASIKSLSRNMQATQQMQTVGAALTQLQQTLNQAVGALKAIKGLPATMNNLQRGSKALAMGSRALAGGVKELVDQTRRIGGGLNEASSFLLGMKHDAEKPSMAGFNIPPQFMTRDEFKQGAAIFISPDGHAARYLIQSALNPFTTGAMDQIEKIVKAAQSAEPNTELSDASVAVAGIPSGLKDTRDYYNADINFIVIATVLIVFLILVTLLRAIVAPLYLIASVLISYLSAIGIGVLVFQLILGQDLHWSLPGLSFILLVSVGADYNMLLISRIRDESPHGVRVGVIRTVGSTGGVITSAGLIFAASMFGLMSASIYTMAEAGFIIGTGILIDTFLVRTITVPALAAMIGQKNWWPSHLGKSKDQVIASQAAMHRQRAQISDQLVRLKLVPGRTTQTSLSALPATSYAPLATPRKRPLIPEDQLVRLRLIPSRKTQTSLSANTRLATPRKRPLIPEDLLVRLKLIPSRKTQTSLSPLPASSNALLTNGHASDKREKTPDSRATTNGKPPIDGISDHALPLFDLTGPPDHLTDDLWESPSDSLTTTNGNGKNKIDRYLGHPLPLFGQNVLSLPPVTIRTNGNGHANGNGNGNGRSTGNGNGNSEQPIDHDLGHALPLFGANVLSDQPTNGHGNGNGNGKRPVDDPMEVT